MQQVRDDGNMGETRRYAGAFVYLNDELAWVSTANGRFVPAEEEDFKHETHLRDHLGNTRVVLTKDDDEVKILQDNNYYPFGMSIKAMSYTSLTPGPYGQNRYLYNGKEFQPEFGLDWLDYGARFYDPQIGRWHVIDPHAENYFPVSPYAYVGNNPIKTIDPNGMDWYDILGTIKWFDNEGEMTIGEQTYQSLGKNVLVGFHSRDEDGNEEINAARFELYLESNTDGATATINGNTVPSDTKKFGTLAEGLYKAESASRSSYTARGKEDLALIIDGGKAVPTVNGNPNKKNSDMLTGIFFHSGNPYQESLKDRAGNPVWSHGCMTSGSGPGSKKLHNDFMKQVGNNFKGNFYLRSNLVDGGTISGVTVSNSGSPYLKPKMGLVTISK